MSDYISMILLFCLALIACIAAWATPSMVLLLYMAGIACHAAWVLMKIKKYEEEEKPNINNFSVYLKYKSAVRCFGMRMAISAAIFIAIYNVSEFFASRPFFCIFMLGLTYHHALMSVSQKLIIKDNQITHINPLKHPFRHKTFTFEDIKKVELDYGFYTEGDLLLTVSQEYFHIELKCINFEYNNIGMLVERLKNVGLIGVDENLNELTMPENNRHLVSNRFVVKNKKYFAVSCVFAVFVVLVFALMIFFSKVTGGDFVVMVLFFTAFLFCWLYYITVRMIFDNGVFEYGAIVRKKFKTHEISHVKLWPHIDYFFGADVFLKDGKCVYKTRKDSDNFDLLIETLKREGVAFR